MWKLARNLLFAAVLIVPIIKPQAAKPDKYILLIPGFFNFPGHASAVGLQYFSPAIVRTVRDHGYTPVVFDNLDPVGSVEENGRRVLANLQTLATEHPTAEFAALTHSAGGLYLAYALTVQPRLPVRAAVTISTPYGGAELVDLLNDVPGFKEITSTVNLSSLQEFESKKMSQILAAMKIPRHVRWITVAAQQPACLLFFCERAQYQSWLLSSAWHLVGKNGDGVVSVESSLGSREMEAWEDLTIPLEHWETVLDANFFVLLGVTNPHWIDEQQRESFTKILRRLNF